MNFKKLFPAFKNTALPEKDTDSPASLTDNKMFYISQQKLIWYKFRRHKMAIISLVILIVLYLGAIFCEFLSPYLANEMHDDYKSLAPQIIRFTDESGLSQPYVYGLKRELDMNTFERVTVIDPEVKYPVHFFTTAQSYKMWGIIETNIHLFASEGPVFILGTDIHGRDMFSRILYGSRISLSIGLVGIAVTFLLGLTLGGISGYFGGVADEIVQRLSDLIICIPSIPLWMVLAAAMPHDWSSVKTYISIVLITSAIGWTGLARTVRGKMLTVREENFVMAARLAGAGTGYIIRKHMLPTFSSYIIVSLTMSIPNTILGETSLSFLGLGLQSPAVSWGVLLQNAQNLQSISGMPWLLLPVLWVIVTVVMFNFIGDGLRDAVDPYGMEATF